MKEITLTTAVTVPSLNETIDCLQALIDGLEGGRAVTVKLNADDGPDTFDGSDAEELPDGDARMSASDVQLDSQGLPWDARIHAASKTTLKKTGEWKRKRGIDPTYAMEVEAELRAAMSAPEAPAAPMPQQGPPPTPAPEAPAAPVQRVTSDGSVWGEDALLAAGYSQEQIAALPVAEPEPSITTFAELVTSITTSKIAQPAIMAALTKAGVESLPALAHREDLIPSVAADLGL